MTSNDHFRTEIEQGTRKEKLIQEKLDALKTHVEQLEEVVSQKIVNLKELKANYESEK